MRGDWERLAPAPSGAEVEAALAAVRLRGAHLAGRRARIRRAGRTAGLALLLAGAWAGGLLTAPGLRLSGDAADPAGPEWWNAWLPPRPSPWQQEPLARLAALPPAPAVPSGTHRYRITRWTEVDGQRMNEAIAWVEGPPGTGFDLSDRFPSGELRGLLALGLRIIVTADSTRWQWVSLTQYDRGRSARGLRVTESGTMFGGVRAARGQPIEILPDGAPRRGQPVTVIRIEGPDMPPPPDGVAWREPDASRLQLVLPLQGWFRGQDPAAARARGVRVGVERNSPPVLQVHWSEPPVLVRIEGDSGAVVETVVTRDLNDDRHRSFALRGQDGRYVAWRFARGDSIMLCLGPFGVRPGDSQATSCGRMPPDGQSVVLRGKRVTVRAIP